MKRIGLLRAFSSAKQTPERIGVDGSLGRQGPVLSYFGLYESVVSQIAS